MYFFANRIEDSTNALIGRLDCIEWYLAYSLSALQNSYFSFIARFFSLLLHEKSLISNRYLYIVCKKFGQSGFRDYCVAFTFSVDKLHFHSSSLYFITNLRSYPLGANITLLQNSFN